MRIAAGLVLYLLCCAFAAAEQFSRFGPYEVHYVVINTTFLEPEVAARLGLTRADTTALVNVSALEDGAGAVRARVSGTATNLLGTEQRLEFREIHEGDAIYYVAPLRFSEAELWRFAIDLELPDGRQAPLRFQQQLYLQ